MVFNVVTLNTIKTKIISYEQKHYYKRSFHPYIKYLYRQSFELQLAVSNK